MQHVRRLETRVLAHQGPHRVPLLHRGTSRGSKSIHLNDFFPLTSDPFGDHWLEFQQNALLALAPSLHLKYKRGKRSTLMHELRPLNTPIDRDDLVTRLYDNASRYLAGRGIRENPLPSEPRFLVARSEP